ncbi:MAG: TIGR03560 family F420-dependent LLM class oxidoreductase [Thermomicrobiales bacterium]
MVDRHELRFGLVVGQRASFQEMVRRAEETEAFGFDSFMVVDHFYGLFDVMEPTHEAYTMLAALAPYTSRVRLGVMVCGNTYRNPAFLLKQAVTVDHVSGGRVDFGVGAGWVEREHEAYGFPFPSAGERVDRFAEALEIWDLLQQEERTTYDGEHYQLLDAPFEPKPLQRPRMPVLIGASGPRMLRLTARHADIWNARGMPDEAAAGNEKLDQFCREVGRDPREIIRSISPAATFLESPEAFAKWTDAYREVGFTDFQIPWPRDDAQYAVLQQVATGVLPGLRET